MHASSGVQHYVWPPRHDAVIEFKSMGAQLKLRAALPLDETIAIAPNRCINTRPCAQVRQLSYNRTLYTWNCLEENWNEFDFHFFITRFWDDSDAINPPSWKKITFLSYVITRLLVSWDRKSLANQQHDVDLLILKYSDINTTRVKLWTSFVRASKQILMNKTVLSAKTNSVTFSKYMSNVSDYVAFIRSYVMYCVSSWKLQQTRQNYLLEMEEYE